MAGSQTPWCLSVCFGHYKKTTYTDQTGQFPIISQWGHKYIMVAIEVNGNYIDTDFLMSWNTKDLVHTYQTIHQHWKDSQAVHINWHILDNEAPCELKSAKWANGCTVKLTPLKVHRHNNAEWAIQTFKGHFIAILSGIHNSFPNNKWIPSCQRLSSHWIYSVSLMSPQRYLPTLTTTALSSSAEYPSSHLAVQFNSMSNQIATKHGVNIPWMVGILVLLLNIIALTSCL